MNCRTCHYELSQCLDARLPSGRRALVMQHTAECERCAQFWAELQAARELALRLQRHRTGPDFREQLFARIQAGEGTPPAVFQEHVSVAAKIRYAASGAAVAAAALLVFTLARGSAPKTLTTDGPIAGATPVNAGGAGSSPKVLQPRVRPDGLAPAGFADRFTGGFADGFTNGAVIATPLAATTDVLGLETAKRFQSHVIWTRANSHRIETSHDDLTMRLAWDNMRSMRLCGKVLQELQNCSQVWFKENEMKVELDRLIAQLDRLQQPSPQQPSPEALRGVLPVLRETPRLADIVSQVATLPGTPQEQQQLVLQRISQEFPDVFQTVLPTVTIEDSFDLDPTSIRTFQGQCGLRVIIIGGQLGFPALRHR